MFTRFTRFGLRLLSLSTLSFALLSPSIVRAGDLQTQDIILSANGAAGANDWEYNATDGQGWVQHTINWQPYGKVQKVLARCVDNCGDEKKFEYRVKLVDGKLVIAMRTTNREKGLIRVQLSALLE